MTEIKEPEDRKRNRCQAPEDIFDPWADWKPQWSKGATNKTPHDFQERHAPTEAVDVKITQERSVQRLRRRVLDVRLWDTLPDAQQDAAFEVERAYTYMTKPVGYQISNTFTPRVDQGRSGVTEWIATIQKSYIAWANDCQKARLSHAAALDVIVFGHSCRTVDRNRRTRKGWTRENLGLCLALWCKMRGWPES